MLGIGDTKPSPATNRKDGALTAQAYMWNFGHGWFSKAEMYWFFMDRVIRLRVPAAHDPRQGPTPLRTLREADGWLCDFADYGEWSAIMPAAEVPAAKRPTMSWMPDRYAACVWRAYQARKPVVELVKPTTPFKRGDGPHGHRANLKGEKYSGGLGFGVTFPAGPVALEAAVKDPTVTSVEFYDGDTKIAVANGAPWTATGTIATPGIHAIIAIGVRADGTRTTSRPAGYVVAGDMWAAAP